MFLGLLERLFFIWLKNYLLSSVLYFSRKSFLSRIPKISKLPYPWKYTSSTRINFPQASYSDSISSTPASSPTANLCLTRNEVGSLLPSQLHKSPLGRAWIAVQLASSSAVRLRLFITGASTHPGAVDVNATVCPCVYIVGPGENASPTPT